MLCDFVMCVTSSDCQQMHLWLHIYISTPDTSYTKLFTVAVQSLIYRFEASHKATTSQECQQNETWSMTNLSAHRTHVLWPLHHVDMTKQGHAF